MSIEIIINGEPHLCADGTSIKQLLNDMKLPLKKIAIERNLEIVPKMAYSTTILAENDRLEIVHFIGGG